MEIVSFNDKETKKVGKILGEEAIKTIERKTHKKALVFALQGELGSGKTTFVQGFAKGLGLSQKITSPTFVILKTYVLNKINFCHIDCYRIGNSKELVDLGFNDIIQDSSTVVLIEWAEKIKVILPSKSVWIEFNHLEHNKRQIKILTKGR